MLWKLILQLSVCIAGNVFLVKTVERFQKEPITEANFYGPPKSFDVTKILDKVQSDFKRCYVINTSDWMSPFLRVSTGGDPASFWVYVNDADNAFYTPVARLKVIVKALRTTLEAVVGLSGAVFILWQAEVVAGWLKSLKNYIKMGQLY